MPITVENSSHHTASHYVSSLAEGQGWKLEGFFATDRNQALVTELTGNCSNGLTISTSCTHAVRCQSIPLSHSLNLVGKGSKLRASPAVPTNATISPGIVVCPRSLAEQPKSPSFNLSLATRNMLAPVGVKNIVVQINAHFCQPKLKLPTPQLYQLTKNTPQVLIGP